MPDMPNPESVLQRTELADDIPEVTAQTQALPSIWFEPPHKYWTQTKEGVWYPRQRVDIMLVLKAHGLTTHVVDGLVSPADTCLLAIQDNRNIQYAGPLAGYPDGIHENQGVRFLVTRGPKLIEPAQGQWPTLRRLFSNMLGADEDDTQMGIFLSWLKLAIEQLRGRIIDDNMNTLPGQALALVGPAGSCKSLTQNLITELLGGRCARPYQAMLGGTTFNGDWFESEHLAIEDESPSTDIRARRQLGSWIKQITVNETQRCHRKGRDAIMLRPFWRLTMSLNDEPENLNVLPPLDESLSDKITILKTVTPLQPLPTRTQAERTAYWTNLTKELPSFVHFLLNSWSIPHAYRSSRFGVMHFHNPNVLRALESMSPEARLLELMDMELFSTPAAATWSGSSLKLEQYLTAPHKDCRREAKALFTFRGAAGAYLGRLAKRLPLRVKRGGHKKGITQWEVHPPQP